MNLGDILPLAIGVAISPVPIIAVILMLFSAKAKSNGLAFLVGWVGALVIAGGIVLTLANAGKISEGGTPSTVSFIIKLLLGKNDTILRAVTWEGNGWNIYDDSTKQYEVIDNIYENPELLKHDTTGT